MQINTHLQNLDFLSTPDRIRISITSALTNVLGFSLPPVSADRKPYCHSHADTSRWVLIYRRGTSGTKSIHTSCCTRVFPKYGWPSSLPNTPHAYVIYMSQRTQILSRVSMHSTTKRLPAGIQRLRHVGVCVYTRGRESRVLHMTCTGNIRQPRHVSIPISPETTKISMEILSSLGTT